MYRSITMRIEPNSSQRKYIDESIRIHHYVYNSMITAVRIYFSNNGRLPSQNTLNRLCTKIWNKNPWMHTIYQNTMNMTVMRVLAAFKSCNPEIKQRNNTSWDGSLSGKLVLKSPRFKKLARSNCFGYLANNTFSIVNYVNSVGKECRGLKLGKMDGILRCYNQSTPINGIPKTVIITRKSVGSHYEYFATVQFE